MNKRVKKPENLNEEISDKVIRWSDRALLALSILLFVLSVIGFVRFYV